jgi:hypothetical protein
MRYGYNVLSENPKGGDYLGDPRLKSVAVSRVNVKVLGYMLNGLRAGSEKGQVACSCDTVIYHRYL